MAGTLSSFSFLLASSSPRRSQLLAEAGYRFKVVDPPIHEPDETMSRLPPTQQAEALAYFKARAVAEGHPDVWVLAADTIVSLNDQILGKPADQADAQRMLEALSGSRHAVITGVALLGPQGQRLIASETSYVTMRKMSEEEIHSYLDSGEWLGKAGAYAIQETADRFIKKAEGSFTNVVGLPMELVAQMFEEMLKHPEAHKVT